MDASFGIGLAAAAGGPFGDVDCARNDDNGSTAPPEAFDGLFNWGCGAVENRGFGAFFDGD